MVQNGYIYTCFLFLELDSIIKQELMCRKRKGELLTHRRMFPQELETSWNISMQGRDVLARRSPRPEEQEAKKLGKQPHFPVSDGTSVPAVPAVRAERREDSGAQSPTPG